METFLIGNSQVQFGEFQQRRPKAISAAANGFEIAYLSHWPFLHTTGQLEIPPELLTYFKNNQNLFCRDQISHNSGWSYLAVVGSLEYLFFSNEELSFKRQHAQITTNPEVNSLWPQLTDFIAALPFDVVSAAVFALDPKSRIALHTDKARFGMDKLLIPLNRPQDAFFAFYHYGAVPLEAGQIYAIDASHPHYAVNQSDEIRYHLIVRGCFEKKLEQYFSWLKQSYAVHGAPFFERIPEGEMWSPSNQVAK